MAQAVDYVIDPLLTRIAKSWSNESFIADQVFPRLNVDSENGKYYVLDSAKTGFTIEKDLRSGITRANRVDYNLTLAPYGPLLEHSLEQGITDDEKRTLGEDRARRSATNNVMTKIMLNHEKMVADTVRNTSIITQNVTLSGSGQFSDYTSDPFSTIQTALDTIDATGISGERIKMFMGYQVWTKLRSHTALINRLGNASTRTPLTTAQLASLFDVDEVIVGRAKYNTAKEGQTPSLSYVWGKDIFIGQYPKNSEIDQIAPGYTLQLAPEGQSARYVDRWDERAKKTEFVRGNDFFQPFTVATEAGYLIKNAVA